MRKKRNGFLLLTGLLGFAATAGAADNGFYLGASIGQSNVKIDEGLAPVDGDDTGYKLIAGIRPLDWLAVEATYVDFGKVKDGAAVSENDGLAAYVVGFLPVGPVDVFAKGGLVKSDASVKLSGIGKTFNSDGTDFAYGIGAQFRLLSLSLRAEYEVFDVKDVKDLNMLSVGVTYTFF
ncbi:MAG TPA: outer membrane beta-barrel protein [Steroidobacteraceae bacterium]|jgi:OOP family OmpA-OmpF porin